MKKLLSAFFALAALIVLFGCPSPVSTLKDDASGTAVVDGTPGSGGSYSQYPLPADVVSDSARSLSGEFTFETLFPVSLDLTVALYEPDPAGGVKPDPLPSNSAAVYASLFDSKGNTVFSGKIPSTGKLKTTVYLPSAEEDITLKLEASGYVSRTSKVSRMVKYQEIKRTMSMLKSSGTSQSRLLLSTGVTAGPDDVFILNIPSTGNITIAFEDLFGQAQAGDADYNDFIASYSIQETYESGLVTKIQVDAEAVKKLAGYNHRFGIRIDSFTGSASLSRTYITASGGTATVSESVNAPAEIVLFEKSSTAVGKAANFTLTFDTPQSVETGGLSRPPYNPYVNVLNTGHDIHLVDRQPITGSINPSDRFFDSEGFPWALLVPADWESPAEGQRIEDAYPRFTNWRESGGSGFTDWYNYPGQPYEPEPVVYAAGYAYLGSQSSAAYWSVDGSTVTRNVLTTAGATFSVATDIAAAGSNLYISGYFNNGSVDTAVYWKNGTSVQLEVNARASGIAVAEDGSVYVSGYYNNGTYKTAVYWVDSGSSVIRHDLHVSSAAEATGIAVSATGSVYVSGFYRNGSLDSASYWVDSGGALQRLDLYTAGLSLAYGIARYGADVYIAGAYRDSSGSIFAALWKNNSTGIEILNTSNAIARGAAGTDSGGIAAGDYSGSVRRAASWSVDGSGAAQTDLPGIALGPSNAYGVEVSGGDIYVTGSYTATVEEAAFWKNGILTSLDSGIRSRANALVIIP